MAPLELGDVSNGQTILSVASLVLSGGFVTVIVAVFKARPERDAVIVLPFQKLNEQVTEHARVLQDDLDRERRARIAAEARIETLESLIDRLEREAKNMRGCMDKLEVEVAALRKTLEPPACP